LLLSFPRKGESIPPSPVIFSNYKYSRITTLPDFQPLLNVCIEYRNPFCSAPSIPYTKSQTGNISFYVQFSFLPLVMYSSSKRLDLMDFSGGLVLPVSPLLERPIKYNGPRARAIINATTTIPAFIRMEYNRRFAFLGMGNINIYLADFHAVVAPVADILIENYWTVGCGYIWNSDDFFLRHFSLQKSLSTEVIAGRLSFPLVYSGIVLVTGFVLLLHVAPEG
jgi:hypothetical protein